MHGLGNDFVVIDCRRKRKPGLRKKAAAICHRRFGVGCDQIIVIDPSRRADCRMRIYNADGSEVEMCGNGVRCLAKYLWDRKDRVIRRKKEIEVETLAGIVRPRMVENGLVEVDMGEPVLDGESVPTTIRGKVIGKALRVGAKSYLITAVSMGNPHCVIFVDDVDKVDLWKEGPALETHKMFPNRANVEFVQQVSRNRIKTRVWERGSGATLACGTGACAATVACVLNGKTGRNVRVDLPGGTLRIKWDRSNRVFMTGPATEVFSGQMKI